MAHRQSSWPKHSPSRRAIARIEVLLLLGLLLICVVLTLVINAYYSGTRIRDLPPGFRCAANLKGIGTGLYTYGSENRDMFPIPAHRPATEPGFAAIQYAPGAIGLNADRESTETDEKVSTTRAFWMLVRDGASAPGSFICPSTDDVKADIDDPLLCWDFGTTQTDCTAGLKEAFTQVSYGYQVPFGLMGQPGAERPQEMALAADRGPFSPALEQGEPHPGRPRLPANAPEKDWAAWNSPNHGGEGQNVLFADTRVEFLTTPTVGVDDDNIYTRWTKPGDEDSSPANRMNGTPPTGKEAPYSETDSLIYP